MGLKRIPTLDPGIEWYADQILSAKPFSFVRYGEGEWRFIVPDIPEKSGRYSFWKFDEAQEKLRQTVLKCHDADRYFPALWHQPHLNAHGWLDQVKKWFSDNSLGWIKWHRGRVWRLATEGNRMGVVVSAIREQKLPVIVVGPQRISRTVKELGAKKFIPIHPRQAYWDIEAIEQELLNFDNPAFISFSAGCNTKMMIHSLWPKIGHHSFMVDFGATWDGLCGNKTRPYHRSLDAKRMRVNWGRR